MTYATDAAAVGREPFWLLELDLDHVTSSTSATNTDGSPCYDTPHTSQSFAPLTVGVKTRYFQRSTSSQMAGLQAIPSIQSVSFKDDEVEVASGLSQFSSATVTLLDHVDDDITEDPYYSSRSPSPSAASYWRRLKARVKYFTNRTARLRTGYYSDTYDSSSFKTRTYKIKSVSGPDENGKVRISLVSPLQVLNIDNAEFPEATPWKLDEAIEDTDLSLVIDGVVDDYGTDLILRINREIITGTRSGNDVTITGRGQYGTTAADHSAGSSIQICHRFEDQFPDEIISHILTESGVDASMIDSAAWASARNTWLGLYSLDVLITKPTKATRLIDELCVSTISMVWNDAESNAIDFRPVRPVSESSITDIDDDDLLAPVRTKEDLSARVSRCDVLMGLRSPVERPAEDESYKLRLVPGSEGNGSTEHKTTALRKVRTRWLDETQISLGARVAITIRDTFVDGRTKYTLHLDESKAESLGISSIIRVTTKDILDAAGDEVATLMIVTGKQPETIGHDVKITAEPFLYSGRYAFLNPTGGPANYSAATNAQKDPGWFLSDTDGKLPNGDPGYKLA